MTFRVRVLGIATHCTRGELWQVETGHHEDGVLVLYRDAKSGVD